MGKIKNVLKNMDIYVGATCFVVMVVIIVVNVTLRYCFRMGFSWAEELILILFVWASYMGIVASYRYDRHIRVEVLFKLFPKPLQKFVDLLTDIGILVLSAYVTYLAIILCNNVGTKRTLAMRLPINVVNSCLVVAFGLISVAAFYRIFTKIKGTYVLEDPFASPLDAGETE